jgi:hypothetical protein
MQDVGLLQALVTCMTDCAIVRVGLQTVYEL